MTSGRELRAFQLQRVCIGGIFAGALPPGPGNWVKQLMVFRRAPAKQSHSQATPGVKPSIFNRCSLISSGLESLDAALGGTAFSHGDIKASINWMSTDRQGD